jgi:hypothetical protein
MAVTINASTSTGLVQSADNSGVIQLQSNGTTALTVNTNEGIQILNCLGVGNATPSTSGAGITFPATQSASTDANTLDDYEEGTWTPTNPDVSFAAGTFGTYTKIGNMVYCAYKIVYPSTANSNPSKITGLPFTSANYVDSVAGGFMTYSTYTTAPIQTIVGSLSTIADFFRNGSTNGPTNAQMSGQQARGVIIYQV